MQLNKGARCCPGCRSDKYTSLPFGNRIDATGSAQTYRCLVCGSFFSGARRSQAIEHLLFRAALKLPDDGMPARDLDLIRNMKGERHGRGTTHP